MWLVERGAFARNQRLNIVNHVDDLIGGQRAQRLEKASEHVTVLEGALKEVVKLAGRAVVMAKIVVVALDQGKVGGVLPVLNGDLDEDLSRKPQFVEVDFHGVAGNDTGILEPLNPSSDGGRGEVNQLGQVADLDASVPVKLFDDGKINFVWHGEHLIF